MTENKPGIAEFSAAQPKDTSRYPLSAELTHTVVNYLNVFRFFITIAMLFAYNTGAMVVGQALNNPVLATTTLVAYFILAVYFFYEVRRFDANHFFLAQTTLFVDIGFLALLLYIFGGIDSGIGVLLVFFTACSALLLPLRSALFFASLSSLAILGESVLGGLLRTGQIEHLVRSGVYGGINFVAAVLAHLLAYSARDYRLIAERQQQTLTRLEQINELIIRRMRSGVLAVDRQFEIRMMNESAWYLLGSPPALERMLPEVSPELFEAMVNWRENPTEETRQLTLNASQASVLPKFVALPGNRAIKVLIFLEDNDIVARRAVEMSTHALAKLSGSIAHEIRNPLAAVSHAAQLMAESEDIPEQDKRMLDIIQQQSKRMNGIVENILQLSRREKSRPELFELNEWLEDLANEFRNSLASDEFVVRYEGPDHQVLVMFDRSQLHQALWKLMENATDYAGREGEPPLITLRLSMRGKAGYCVVSVEDNGPGIPEDRIRNIFEPFYTTRQKGSGLGLYVARQLCEANQSELTVDSSPQQGTRFHLRLETAQNERGAELNSLHDQQAPA